MRLLIVSRVDDNSVLEYTRDLSAALIADGHEIEFERETGKALSKEGASLTGAAADLVIIVGGDGSVLHTVQKLSPQLPVIGINRGRVGFLADLESEEAVPFFHSAARAGFQINPRMRISLSSDSGFLGNALNEAVIVTERPAKMLQFSVIVDDIPAETFRADGIVISTPTGSTAYAMSAGGPIIDPQIEGVLLVPLAPYMLSSRPHLISTQRTLSIRLESDKPANLVLDGRKTAEIEDGTTVTIRKSPEPALFVDSGKSFFVKVDRKLRRL